MTFCLHPFYFLLQSYHPPLFSFFFFVKKKEKILAQKGQTLPLLFIVEKSHPHWLTVPLKSVKLLQTQTHPWGKRQIYFSNKEGDWFCFLGTREIKLTWIHSKVIGCHNESHWTETHGTGCQDSNKGLQTNSVLQKNGLSTVSYFICMMFVCNLFKH